MPTYTPSTPIATDFPSTSQPQMLANFQYLIPAAGPGTGLERDHTMLLDSTLPGDGTHRQVTMTANLVASPGFTGGVSVVYPKTANGGSQLFYDNALITGVQMTVAKVGVPTIAVSGCSFLPGGILIQWGTGTNTIVFPVAFTTIYSATAVPLSFPTSGTAMTTLTNTGLFYGQSNGNAFNINWMAIGLA